MKIINFSDSNDSIKSQFVELIKEAFHEDHSFLSNQNILDRYQSYCYEGDTFFLLIDDISDILYGCIGMNTLNNNYYINNLAVFSKFRNNGYSKILTKYIENLVINQYQKNKIYLECKKHYIPFYIKMGYILTEKIHNYSSRIYFKIDNIFLNIEYKYFPEYQKNNSNIEVIKVFNEFTIYTLYKNI